MKSVTQVYLQQIRLKNTNKLQEQANRYMHTINSEKIYTNNYSLKTHNIRHRHSYHNT